MISNKTAAALFFILLTMDIDVSASKRAKKPGSSGKAVLTRKRKLASKGKNTGLVLHDTTSAVNPVEAIVENTGAMSISQEQPVSQVNEFEDLIKRKNFKEIFELGGRMGPDDFLKQLSSVVKTLGQYNGIISGLNDRGMVARFYLYGDVGVIKKATVESRVYEGYDGYIKNGDLEAAFPLAFKEGHHDRIVELLKMRQEITTERDKRTRQRGFKSNFEYFVEVLLLKLDLEKDGMPLRRFLASHGEELREKHPDILDTLCQQSMVCLRSWSNEPKTKKLITDLIGQPLLLTPVTFAKGFLHHASEEIYSNFVGCAWDEAIQEGLTNKDLGEGGYLWQTMTKVRPKDFIGAFPSTPDALAVVIGKFPTKEKLEVDWYKGKVAILFGSINGLESIILPDVLWPIIFGYLISLTFTEDPVEIEPKKEPLDWRRDQEGCHELTPSDLEKNVIATNLQILAKLWNLKEPMKTTDLEEFLETMD